MSSCRIRDELDWDLRSFMSGLFPDTGLGTGASRDMAEARGKNSRLANSGRQVDLFVHVVRGWHLVGRF